MHRLAALNIEPRPSRILLIGSGVAHGLAGVATIVASVPLWAKAGLLVGIGLSLAWTGYRYGWRRGGGFISRVELLDGRWCLETGDGIRHPAGLTGGYAQPGIVVLNFRLEGGWRRSVVLLPDAVDSETLRRLRVWLRTRRDEGGSECP
ncbi:MAG: protein YgfX [Candidatus Competibacteraceae bacterium]